MDGSTGGQETKREAVYHGGGLAVARLRFPHAPEPWIDLSTGINPHPYPIGVIPAERWTRLPEPSEVAALEAAAAVAFGAASGTVVAAPGTQALIERLPGLFAARRAGILGFTYQEHAEAWGRAGARVATVDDPDALEGFDVAVVVNPNNPDGRLVAPGALAALARRMAASGGRLVVDEAFVVVLPAGSSVVPQTAPGMVVLRSFGKAYGLAGLRLGFAVAAPADAERLRSALGPWAVCGPAIEIACRAYADRDWLDASVARLAEGAGRLDGLLSAAGFSVVGGTPLFRLAARPDAAAWFERLGRAGILVRPFPARPDWLRFGIPSSEHAWARLERVLAGA